jgi:hypothetical protein
MGNVIAIHQPNLLPWFPFYEKMAACDVFVFMVHCQFEKNGYTNRARVFNKWWTMPVINGKEPIHMKQYVIGKKLLEINIRLILSTAEMLGIDIAKIKYDFPTEALGTDRVIEICKEFGGDRYMADKEAPNKYLDVKRLTENGIEFVPFESAYKKHVFELFNEIGIESCQKIIAKRLK